MCVGPECTAGSVLAIHVSMFYKAGICRIEATVASVGFQAFSPHHTAYACSTLQPEGITSHNPKHGHIINTPTSLCMAQHSKPQQWYELTIPVNLTMGAEWKWRSFSSKCCCMAVCTQRRVQIASTGPQRLLSKSERAQHSQAITHSSSANNCISASQHNTILAPSVFRGHRRT